MRYDVTNKRKGRRFDIRTTHKSPGSLKLRVTSFFSRRTIFTLSILIWITSIASLYLVSIFTATVVLLAVEMAAYAVLAYRDNNSSNWLKQARIFAALTSIILSIVWLIAHPYALLIVLQALGLAIGIFDFILRFIRGLPRWKNRKLIKQILAIVQIAVILAGTFAGLWLIKIATNPEDFVISLRRDGSGNSFEAPASQTVAWEEDYYYTNDVSYESKYPNGFFDIYSSEEDFSVQRPVFIYAHGGGFAYGDKFTGDPNVAQFKGFTNMAKTMLKAGYTVISYNYALAPEYKYPTPMVQMSELIQFLQKHSKEFGADMKQVVLGGGSAGAHMSGQFSIIQTNPEYAKEMGIEPVISGDDIKAVYFGSALFDPTRAGHSGVFPIDYVYYQLGRAYLGVGSLEESKKAKQANLTAHVTKDFPAAYITDGFIASFPDQAHEMDYKLDGLGVDHRSLIYDWGTTDSMLMHGYDVLDNKEAEVNLRNFLDFLSERVDYTK